MSKKIPDFFILITVFVIMLGLVLGVWVYTSQDKFFNEKTFVLNDRSQSEFSVDLSDIYPGRTISYKICLKANKGDYFNITIELDELGESSLADFLGFEIRYEGETIDKASLKEYVEGKKCNFKADFSEKKTVEVEFVYIMDVGVGDEAQGATADFNIVLSAKR